MQDTDNLQRFLFERTGVRGELVHLDSSWRAVLSRHAYPPTVRSQLGQALAAAALLSATIKLEGQLILQIQGNGPLHTLVAQSSHRRTIRGLARWRGEVGEGSLPEVFGTGKLVMTIDSRGFDRYQGIVAIEGSNLAQALKSYFVRSEQLPTALWLAADAGRAAGLLVQRLPSAETIDEDWNRIITLAGTVDESELLALPVRELLFRLFSQEEVRLFDPEPVSFACGCSLPRIEAALLALGHSEIHQILKQREHIDIDCEFCNRHYRLDRVDVERVFAQSIPIDVPRTRH